MIETKEVIEFFDRLAPGWDAEMIRSDEIINTILDNAAVTGGKDILDVACGTGVLTPDYLKRNVASVTGIDISPKMAEIARAKFLQERVRSASRSSAATWRRQLLTGSLTVLWSTTPSRISPIQRG